MAEYLKILPRKIPHHIQVRGSQKVSRPKNWKKMTAGMHTRYTKKLGHAPRCTVSNISTDLECGTPINVGDWYHTNATKRTASVRCVVCAERIGFEVPDIVKDPPIHEKLWPSYDKICEQVKVLHPQGMTDQEMADIIGVSKYKVAKSRKILEFKSNQKTRQFTDERLRELHGKGLNDPEIAKMIMRNKKTV